MVHEHGGIVRRTYWENAPHGADFDLGRIDLPMAAAVFPHEIWRAPRAWAERMWPNLFYWNEVDKGGHFAAFELAGAFYPGTAEGYSQRPCLTTDKESEMSKNLAGKVALVTGGSRGLGAAVAAALADQGADIAISYVASDEKARAVVDGLKAKGVRAVAIKADQGDPAASEPLVRTVVEQFGRLDILVNNAAVAWQGKTIDAPDIDNAAMDKQWAINTMGVIANIRAAVKVLPDGGRIISVGSGLGTRIAFPGTADYAASKAAVVGYSKGAARDLGVRNITVNVVQAGMMDTDMAAGSKGKLPPIIMESHAIHRYAAVEEVAAAIVFLAGPDAGFITGSVIDVNGGFTA